MINVQHMVVLRTSPNWSFTLLTNNIWNHPCILSGEVNEIIYIILSVV